VKLGAVLALFIAANNLSCAAVELLAATEHRLGGLFALSAAPPVTVRRLHQLDTAEVVPHPERTVRVRAAHHVLIIAICQQEHPHTFSVSVINNTKQLQ